MKFANGSMSRAIGPDEILKGMLITVLHGRKFTPMNFNGWMSGGIATQPKEQEDRSGMGKVLRVKSACLPYVTVVDLSDRSVFNDGYYEHTYYIRDTTFGLVTREFARSQLRRTKARRDRESR